jgi:hypothetical protein
MSSFGDASLVSDSESWETSPMTGPRTITPPLDGGHYREMAQGLRKLAHQCRFAGARRELLDLAASYERRAEFLDGRAR